MKIEQLKTPMSLSFDLFLDQIQQAYEIYREHCFSCDFINRSSDRRQEGTGLCNLPYESLPDENELLSEAYSLYCKWEDCNVAYNVTLDKVIDEIEQQIDKGRLVLQDLRSENAKLTVVIEDSIIGAVYSSTPNIQLEIIELDRNYADTKIRDQVYEELAKNSGLMAHDGYTLTVPGYEQKMEVTE